MANTYSPDGWVVIKISGDDPHYRVFGSWSGSYTTSDVWRLNSGIVRAAYIEELKAYQFDGHSGSIYYCNEDSYGRLALYNQSILDGYIKNSNNVMEVLSEDTDWVNMDWILK